MICRKCAQKCVCSRGSVTRPAARLPMSRGARTVEGAARGPWRHRAMRGTIGDPLRDRPGRADPGPACAGGPPWQIAALPVRLQVSVRGTGPLAGRLRALAQTADVHPRPEIGRVRGRRASHLWPPAVRGPSGGRPGRCRQGITTPSQVLTGPARQPDPPSQLLLCPRRSSIYIWGLEGGVRPEHHLHPEPCRTRQRSSSLASPSSTSPSRSRWSSTLLPHPSAVPQIRPSS